MNKKVLLDKEFHFGIGFLNEVVEGTGIRIDQWGSQDPSVFYPKLMYYSLLYSYKRQQKEIDFTPFTIADLIDENGGIGGKFWNDFDNAFVESMNKDVPADTDKKKSDSKEIDFKADVIAFACGELGIMRLDDVYNMTFAEFQIRLFAYKRMQLREWEKVRQICWSAFIGSHQDPKKMPKSIDKFMNLDFGETKKSGVSDAQKERYLEAMKEYLKQTKNG